MLRKPHRLPYTFLMLEIIAESRMSSIQHEHPLYHQKLQAKCHNT